MNAWILLFAVPPVGVKVKRTLTCIFTRCLSALRAEAVSFSFSLFTPAVTVWVSRLIHGFRLLLSVAGRADRPPVAASSAITLPALSKVTLTRIEWQPLPQVALGLIVNLFEGDSEFEGGSGGGGSGKESTATPDGPPAPVMKLGSIRLPARSARPIDVPGPYSLQ